MRSDSGENAKPSRSPPSKATGWPNGSPTPWQSIALVRGDACLDPEPLEQRAPSLAAVHPHLRARV